MFKLNNYHSVRKVRATNPQSYPSNIWFTSFCRGGIFIQIYQFSSDRLFSSSRKTQHFKNYLSSFLKNVEYRAVIKFFTRKSLKTTEISKELNSIYEDDAPSYRTVAKWVAALSDPEGAFEDSLRMGHPSTITTDENIQAVERIVMHDRHICLSPSLRIAYSNNNSLSDHE